MFGKVVLTKNWQKSQKMWRGNDGKGTIKILLHS